MAIQIQLRQGTTTEHNTFTGAQGELTYDTTLKSLVLHDGVTAGGVKIPYLSNGRVPSTMLPTATESVIGASKIATTAIALAGTDDANFITPKKLRDALNATGTLPLYALRSWGIVQGTATPATLVKGANIASVVDEGVGQYRITFATPMPDLNYAVLFGSTTYALTDAGTYGTMKIGTKTVNGFVISCGQQSYVDVPEVSFGVIY